MSPWSSLTVRRVRQAVRGGRVRFTLKSLQEFAVLGMDEADVLEILARLTESEAASRLRSKRGGGWMYVFRPEMIGARLYIKLLLQDGCVVISFHEDEESESKK